MNLQTIPDIIVQRFCNLIFLLQVVLEHPDVEKLKTVPYLVVSGRFSTLAPSIA